MTTEPRSPLPGEVYLGVKLHQDTAEFLRKECNSIRVYEVRGKARPMLVLSARVKQRQYVVLEFTSKPPKEHLYDYACGADGVPKTFDMEWGLREPSYMRIYPPQFIPEKLLVRKLSPKSSGYDLIDFHKLHIDCHMRSAGRKD